MAFCQAIESIAGVEIPIRASYVRVVLLELERIYNHVADVGAISTDTGFAFANAHAMRRPVETGSGLQCCDFPRVTKLRLVPVNWGQASKDGNSFVVPSENIGGLTP